MLLFQGNLEAEQAEARKQEKAERKKRQEEERKKAEEEAAIAKAGPFCNVFCTPCCLWLHLLYCLAHVDPAENVSMSCHCA